MKRKMLSVLLCAAMMGTTLAGATSVLAADDKDSDSKWEYKEATLTFLIDPDTASAGYQAVFDLCEKETGIHIETELRASGGDGDNQVKTRLASGEMTDLCGYNSGAKLNELDPESNFIDISGEEWASRLDDTAVIGSLGDSWTIQVPYLGDHYNVLAAEPDFSEKFEAGEAKYATTPAGLESFQKLADLQPYFNDDYTATTYADACDKIVNGDGAHWFILSQALSSIYELYGDDVNKIGVMGIPGDDADNHGLTVWEPTAIYGNANSDKKDDILRFMEFYTSDEALDAFTEAQKPDGPYCIKGYELPDDAYDGVKEAQEKYFDTGKTNVAMEFQTSVKGTNCEYICSEVATGQSTAEEAAKAYDEDCKKQATQLGLDWK